MRSLEKLLDVSSDPLIDAKPDLRWALGRGVSKALIDELTALLKEKNGFFAFESALLVLPSASHGAIRGLEEWNDGNGWIQFYDRIGRPALFFAQDAFAGQYGITDSDVIGLEPETGQVTLYSRSLEEWAATLLEDYDIETGWSVARKWQLSQGGLRPGDRLLPRKPFVLGGDYAPENLLAVDGAEAMKRLASLYRQIRDTPDGQAITVKGWMSE